MTASNWTLNEVFSYFFVKCLLCLIQELGILMLRLQQSGLGLNEVKWENWNPYKEDNSGTKPLDFNDVLISEYF